MSIITDIRHPVYDSLHNKWCKWRDTYRAGDEFILKYLAKFTRREDNEDFTKRQMMTYVPSFAKAAVNDIKNSIYQRIGDVARLDGSDSYVSAIAGKQNGVDMCGSTMSYFMGQMILPELLTMARVGIYVDMPQLNGPTKLDVANKHPYIYHYCVEDILSWRDDQSCSPNEYKAILLRDHTYSYDLETSLPTCQLTSYRYVYLSDHGTVFVQYYDFESNPTELIELNIPRIPFIMLEITESLLVDVCNYQIALLNLESSDIAYALLANYPFYVEQYDARANSPYVEGPETEEVTVGVTQGRRYPLGTNAPGFIHPSSEPLTASMAKQEALKKDIKALVNLTLSNLSPKGASAESKQFDQQGLEAGLSYIGLILEHGESKIAEYWAMYENQEPATVIYPTDYYLPDSKDVRDEITQLVALALGINSLTYKKEVCKRIIRLSIGPKLPALTLMQIEGEIEQSTICIIDPINLTAQLTSGVISLKLAAEALTIPSSDLAQAKADNAERLALIQKAQTPPTRGVPDTQLNPLSQNKLDKVSNNPTVNP